MIDELVTGLVEREQAVLRELVRLAELNTAQALAEPAFHTASMSIRAQLRAHAAKVEELELLASEQDRASDVEQAVRHVSRHRSEGATLQASLRDLGGKVIPPCACTCQHVHAHAYGMLVHVERLEHERAMHRSAPVARSRRRPSGRRCFWARLRQPTAAPAAARSRASCPTARRRRRRTM